VQEAVVVVRVLPFILVVPQLMVVEMVHHLEHRVLSVLLARQTLVAVVVVVVVLLHLALVVQVVQV
jgi:hypothetical protein